MKTFIGLISMIGLIGCAQSSGGGGEPTPKLCEESHLVGAWDYSDWQAPGVTYKETYRADCSVSFYYNSSYSEYNANGRFKDLNPGHDTGFVEITVGTNKEKCNYQRTGDGRMLVFDCSNI